MYHPETAAMDKPKRMWSKKVLKLKENHGWESSPGYSIFVADRGSVRFDFPKSWIILPTERGSIRFHDRKPPHDDCVMELTVMYLNDQIDWSRLELGPMLRDVTRDESREVLDQSEVFEETRPRLTMAWREIRFLDDIEKREAYSRICLARWSNIQALLTFDFWVDQAHRMRPIWDEVIRTMVLGDYVEDPTQRVLD
jgi:hypothetical protein